MNYKFLLSFLFSAAVTIAFAPQGQAQSELRKGNRYFESHDFALALAQYEIAAAKRTPDLPTAQRIADAYRLTQRSQEAENWYARVVAMPGREPMNLYYYAEALRSNGKYEQAKEQYMRWSEEMPQHAERAQTLMQATDQAKKWLAQLPLAEVTRVPGLNTEGHSDFSPAPYAQGIIFSSDRGGQYCQYQRTALRLDRTPVPEAVHGPAGYGWKLGCACGFTGSGEYNLS